MLPEFSSNSPDDDCSDTDFLYFYHKFHFQENDGNTINAAHALRIRLLLNYLQSKKYKDRYTTNFLLKKDLDKYTSLIDDRDKLNNYAVYINSISKKSIKPPTDCCKWRSNLKNIDSIQSIVQDLGLDKDTAEEKEIDKHLFQKLVTELGNIEKISILKQPTNSTSLLQDSSITASNRNDSNQPKSAQVSELKNNDSISNLVLPVHQTSNSRSVFNHKVPVNQPNNHFANNNQSNIGSFNPTKSIISVITPQCSEYPKGTHNQGNFYNYSTKNVNLPQHNRDRLSNPVKNQVNCNHPQNNLNNQRISGNSNGNQGSIFNGFTTASTALALQNTKQYGNGSEPVKKSLGTRPRAINSKFVPPIKSANSSNNQNNSDTPPAPIIIDERLKGLDSKMIELIENEIMDHGKPVTWDEISGLEFAKKTIQEIVVWPLLRPDIFTGLRRPPKGILLFGPPGTGKTLIGKCIASQSSSTFFSISASSLLSKWIGESEKLVRTLFAVARTRQPAVVFIDEIDSMLSQRSENEHESSRRVKTEFLVQLDGAATEEDDRILVIGATNRPQELDEAARRRLVKRLYIPLPEYEARKHLIQRLMTAEKNNLTEDNFIEIAKLTEGYSGADLKNLCQEASLGPIRSIDFRFISSIESQEVRPISMDDFKSAMTVVRSSVSSSDLKQYLEWDKTYGSSGV